LAYIVYCIVVYLFYTTISHKTHVNGLVLLRNIFLIIIKNGNNIKCQHSDDNCMAYGQSLYEHFNTILYFLFVANEMIERRRLSPTFVAVRVCCGGRQHLLMRRCSEPLWECGCLVHHCVAVLNCLTVDTAVFNDDLHNAIVRRTTRPVALPFEHYLNPAD